MHPKIFTDQYKANAKQVVGDDEFIVIQFAGGQDICNFDPEIKIRYHYPEADGGFWNRNYHQQSFVLKHV